MLRYRLGECKIELTDPEPGDDPVIVTSRVYWDGEDERTLGDVMEGGPMEARPAGELATEIEAWIRDQGRTVSTAELMEEFSSEKPATLRSNLARMVKRGTLTKPMHGHYASRDGRQTPTSMQVDNVAASTSTQVQQVQQVQHDLGNVALVADAALCDVQQRGATTAPIDDWAMALFDRE